MSHPIPGETLAYLAGAIDSDGSIGIKRSTYHIRVRKDSKNAVYSARVDLKQVTPQIPQLLKETFNGNLYGHKAQTANSKPLLGWHSSAQRATNCCRLLLPYLRIKTAQALLVMELDKSRDPKYLKYGYWFEQEHPNWREYDLLDSQQVMRSLRYLNAGSVSQSLNHGNLVGLPYDHSGRWTGLQPRFPKLLVEQLAAMQGEEKHYQMPPRLVAWRERLFQNMKELNKMGIHGTPVYHRTGAHKPKEV